MLAGPLCIQEITIYGFIPQISIPVLDCITIMVSQPAVNYVTGKCHKILWGIVHWFARGWGRICFTVGVKLTTSLNQGGPSSLSLQEKFNYLPFSILVSETLKSYITWGTEKSQIILLTLFLAPGIYLWPYLKILGTVLLLTKHLLNVCKLCIKLGLHWTFNCWYVILKFKESLLFKWQIPISAA
jgi:hypothetical protein